MRRLVFVEVYMAVIIPVAYSVTESLLALIV